MKCRTIAIFLAGLTIPALPVLAQPTGQDEEPAAAAPVEASNADAPRAAANPGGGKEDSMDHLYGDRRPDGSDDRQYEWKTAGRHYVVPLAFFSIHGYLEGVFASGSEDWSAADPTQLGPPGQLLVPNTPNNSFQYDAAIFVSTDLSSSVRSLLELHLVSDPGGVGAAGPGGLTLAVTEASVSWDLYKSYLTLGAGLFWAPFGTVNIDWLGGQALFQLVPRASAAFPAHYNERGVRIDGAKSLGRGVGVNYVFSLGNGLNRFDIAGQRSYDTDGDKTLIGRVGLFPGLGPDLELGFSLAGGTLRETADPTQGADDPIRYPARFSAFGGDITWLLDNLALRGYYIASTEVLDADGGVLDPPDLQREGLMLESSYKLWVDLPVGHIRAIVPKARFDWISVSTLAGGGASAENFQTVVYSLGVDIKSAGTVGAVLSLEYHFQDEIRAAQPLDNNRFVARLLARF